MTEELIRQILGVSDTKKYHITIKPQETKEQIINLVPMAVCESLPQRTKEFTANLTQEQVDMLWETDSIKRMVDLDDEAESNMDEEQAITSKTVGYIRRQKMGSPSRSSAYGNAASNEAISDIAAGLYNYGTDNNQPPLGNWGLLRHTSPTKNSAQFIGTMNQGSSGTYTAPQFYNVGSETYTTLDGEGVDIILNIESIVDVDDPEFMTDGVTRIQEFQWNSLPLRYPPNDPDGNTAGDLILDAQNQQQLNTSVNTIIYRDVLNRVTPYITTANINYDTDVVTIPGHGLQPGDVLSIEIHPDDRATVGDRSIIDGLIQVRAGVTYTVRTVNGDGVTFEPYGADDNYNFVDLSSAPDLYPQNIRVRWKNYTSRVQTLESNTYPFGVDDHAEGVAYCACSNTYGAGTGARIYIWPRNQTGSWSGLKQNGWDSFRLFHQNKVANGNTRPTLVIDSIGARRAKNLSKSQICTGAVYRNEVYTSLAPSGTPEVFIRGYNMQDGDNDATGPAYGSSHILTVFGKISIGPTESRGENGYALPISDTDKSNFFQILNNGWSESTSYESQGAKACIEMMQSGVHHVSSAGNYNNAVAQYGDPDYNNGTFENQGNNENVLGDFRPYNRANYFNPDGTISIAALSPFYYQNAFNSKEVLCDFSTRGSGVDTAACGEQIFVSLLHNGNRNLAGTSFSSPTVAGFLTLVLQQYPTTTPVQLRRFVRDHAVATDKCYDSGVLPIQGSKFGDPAYFNDVFGNRGFSGNIFYLDTNANNWTNPTTLSNDPIVHSVQYQDNQIDFTIDQINSKLDTVEG